MRSRFDCREEMKASDIHKAATDDTLTFFFRVLLCLVLSGMIKVEVE